ncbi:MAG: DUF362 domain-containing protein [Lachnospiraceae bacterium]|nr:DUF362 domain-containing protein [Lachnospiraceae bacterium]
MQKVAIEHADNYRVDIVREALQKCFSDLGYSKENPLGRVIHPGDKVFIKPNWVASRWRESCPHKDTLYCVITHPHVIEAVTDFVAEALNGKGEIIIGDNPSIDADFKELMEFTEIEKIKGKYDVPVQIIDLRPLICDDLKNYGKKNLMVQQAGDPAGKVEVNLGKDSLLYGIDPTRFRGVFDEREDTIASHTGETQLYTYARSLYNADVYISIPKLKTHQKVGATLNLKGLVGSISNKNQLVHWQVGYPEIHGDEYPSKEAYEAGQKAKVKHRGAWPGNDTIWRMVGDLYQGMKKKDRRYFTVIDGIVAGEGQGPFCPTSKNANTIIAGENLLATDVAAVRYMGFNPEKISYLKYFLDKKYEGITLENIYVYENGKLVKDYFSNESRYSDFYVIDSWKEIKV